MSLLKSALVKALKSKATQQAASVVIDKAVKQGKAYLNSQEDSGQQNDTDQLLLGLQHLLAKKPADGVYSIALSQFQVRVTINRGAIAKIDKVE